MCLGRAEAASEDFQLDMATPTASHMVGRCFVATEAGTYFDGTGFLKAGEIRDTGDFLWYLSHKKPEEET